MNNIDEATLEIGDRRILGHVRRLKRSSSVRRIVTALLEKQANVDDIGPLIAAISDPSDAIWRERAVAAWALGRLQLTPIQQEIVVQRLGEILDGCSYAENLKFSRRIQFLKRSLWITVPPLTYVMLQSLISGFDLPPFETWTVVLVIGLAFIIFETVVLTPFLAPLSFALDRRRADEARISAATTLGKLCLPLSVGALAYGAYGRGARVRSASLRALRRVLPTLQENHYGNLSTDAVPNLCRLLKHPNEIFLLELLEALGKVGDGRAVKPVAFLAANTQSSVVKAETVQILPILQERLRQAQDPKILLRASSGATSSDILLRAASASSDTQQSNQLLRADIQDT